jgi:Lrp/AsnC family leucine-responsive transcriptional regulator
MRRPADSCIVNLDRIDLKILAQLVENSRLSHVELSDRVGLSSTACARRLKALEERGVVTGYRTSIDLRRLGLGTTVIVRISLDSQSEEALRSFEKAVVGCPSVVGCFLMSGTDDYLLTVSVADIEDFERVHKTQLSRLPRVARIRSSIALREVVNRSLPPAALAGATSAR